jgi:hypothetical protein
LESLFPYFASIKVSGAGLKPAINGGQIKSEDIKPVVRIFILRAVFLVVRPGNNQGQMLAISIFVIDRGFLEVCQWKYLLLQIVLDELRPAGNRKSPIPH